MNYSRLHHLICGSLAAPSALSQHCHFSPPNRLQSATTRKRAKLFWPLRQNISESRNKRSGLFPCNFASWWGLWFVLTRIQRKTSEIHVVYVLDNSRSAVGYCEIISLCFKDSALGKLSNLHCRFMLIYSVFVRCVGTRQSRIKTLQKRALLKRQCEHA